MSLETIEKLLVGMAPVEAVEAIHSNFSMMKTMPSDCFTGLWNHMYPILKDPENPGHIAAVNGILIGVSLHYGLGHSVQLQKIISDYMLDRSRKRGENVVHFHEAKAGRTLC